MDTHISPVTHCQHLMFVGLVSPCVEPADAMQATPIHNLTVSDAHNNKKNIIINCLYCNCIIEKLWSIKY